MWLVSYHLFRSPFFCISLRRFHILKNGSAILRHLSSWVAFVGSRGGLWIAWSGFEPWPGHCVVFLITTLDSRSASFYPGVSIDKLIPLNLMLGVILRLTCTPPKRGTGGGRGTCSTHDGEVRRIFLG